ncbi:MAG: hypothetical protein N3A69_07055 [Leptospiraceae bacterium]|nr:hypothetical protein [Leptospiraceae bacterium]
MNPTIFDYKIDSQLISNHLNILQSIIQRMANASLSSKTWAITIVSGILAILLEKEKLEFVYLAIIPNLLFGFLDAYYLTQEKRFRESFNQFIQKLNYKEITFLDLQIVPMKEKFFTTFFRAIFSWSVFPFYFTLLVMIFLAKEINSKF